MTDLNCLLQHLCDAEIEFIIVGEFAAMLHGSTLLTRDLDVCAVLSSANIGKLRDILRDLNPTRGPKLLHIALQISSDEALPQPEALLVGCSQKAVRESTPQPQPLLCSGPCGDFERIERAHVDVLDAAGQRLARLTQ